ncbi:MAG: zinc-ribbon domain-containing protein [Lachnospiraceae bacterium]|nr:zinc-ribbon domain-containing protein [Lachnospiraceae bacterium]
MFCSNCGQRLTDDAKHCPNCGVLIRRDTEAQPDPGRPEEPKSPESYSYGTSGESPRPAQDPYANPYSDPYSRPAADPYASPYGAPVQRTKADGYALTGLILSIVSGVCCCIPFIGLPCAILGIIFSAKGLKSESRKAMAVIGLILSIIFTVCNAATGYSVIVALANPDAWQDIMESAGFDYGFEFRFR